MSANRCVVCSSNRTPLEKCDHGQVTVLGEGTYGLVYLCKPPTGGSFVEKVLKLDASVTHLREVQCLQACKHPNVVRLLSTSNPVSGRVTVRMEHCEGGDLFSLLRQRRKEERYFTEAEVVTLLTQMLLAVHYLHAQGVLHRDIKTRNLFLLSTEASALRLKLGDFGCSVQSDLSIAEDQRRTLCGTYASFAPEMLRVDQDHRAQYGKKAETWSVGVVLYELLSLGTPPFTWDASRADTFYDMTQRIIQGSYPTLSAAPLGPDTEPQYSKELLDLSAEMLTVDLEKRPSVRSLLSRPLIKAEALRYLAQLESDEAIILKRQVETLTEPVSFVYRGTCLRVRSSTAEVVDAEIRLASSGTVQFRDVKGKASRDWSAANLADCALENDEFEESDGRNFYGICLRPKKLTAVTFGFYDKDKRDALSNELRTLKAQCQASAH